MAIHVFTLIWTNLGRMLAAIVEFGFTTFIRLSPNKWISRTYKFNGEFKRYLLALESNSK